MAIESGAADASAAKGSRFTAPFADLTVAWLKILAVVLIGGVYAARPSFRTTEAHFFWRQDLPVVAAFIALTALIAVVPASWLRRLRPTHAAPPKAIVLALALLCCAAGALGVSLVFQGYTLSLDEFLANFDARIFAQGRLMAPIDPAWQPFTGALQPMYLLPTPDNDVWASAYLPVNAAMRGLASLVHLRWLVNPALSAFSIVAVYAVGRRLWPEDRTPAVVAAVLLATSAQLMVMSMTAYAMPGHLAFNLAWLWLYLRGGKLGHGGALIVGFLATGLHQLLFHPMFAAPFILQLWLDRRWRLAGLYTLAYAAIGVFWIEFWSLEMRLLGEAAEDAKTLGGGWLVERTLDVLHGVRFDNLGAMGESLTRFVAWQNPLTAPLALVGVAAAVRAKGHLRALVLGVGLTFVAMLILEPSQTHGWGYRYFHGLLGSFALVAGWTWTRLAGALSPDRKAAAEGGLTLVCLVSMLAVTPFRAWQAHDYVRPYAAANAAIQGARAKVVIVDHEGAIGFDPGTVVRNDPFLTQGPKVLELSYMDAATVKAACQLGPVQVFTGQDAARLGVDTARVDVEPQVLQLRALMRQLKCGAPMGPAQTSL
jgi:hypothetical protein